MTSLPKRIPKSAQVALIAIATLLGSNAHAANDWVNFATVSMTNATTPKLSSNYLCYSDGKDILCNTDLGPVYIGTGGVINNGGMTVAGGVSASAVSATYVSGTVIQVNTSTMPCSTGLAGAIRYNSGNIEYCNGSSWDQLANGSGGTLSGGSATAVAFWNGPNSITYESNTTGGLYWDHDNGRLGIGTNAPGSKVAIVSSSGGQETGLSLWNTSFVPQVQLFTGANSPDAGFLNFGNGTGWRFHIGKYSDGGATKFLTVVDNGNVGIGGLTTPTATLQVSGTFAVSNSNQVTSPSLYVTSSGKVAIGTTTPNNPLTVSGTARFQHVVGPGYDAPFEILITSDSSLANWDRITFGSVSPTNMFLETADQANKKTNFYLQPYGGNVSVGAWGTTPASSLTVPNGEVQVGSSGGACTTTKNGGAIRYSAGTLYYCNGSNTWSAISGGGAGFTGGGSATAVAFWNGTNSLTYESATTSGLYWNHITGRLGVGTNSPSYALEVSASGAAADGLLVRGSVAPVVAVSNGTSSTQLGIATMAGYLSEAAQAGDAVLRANTGNMIVAARNSTGGVILATGASNADRLRVDVGGNVGIGTSTPTATLQVSGSMIVSTTGQNTASAASLLVDNRGVSVSSIVHITGSAFSPIGAGGNAILSGTTAVSTSSAGSITFYTGGKQVMQMGSSGNVGIGGFPGSVPLQVTTQTSSTNSTGELMLQGGNQWTRFFTNLGTSNFNGIVASGDHGIIFSNGTQDTGGLVIAPWGSPTKGLRIDASGNVGLGVTDATANPNPGIAFQPLIGRMNIGNTAGTNGQTFVGFYRSGTQIGTVAQNGTTGVTYNTTSDRRVKENITDTREGLQKLMRIGVKDFSFKADPSHTIVNGFIAQDLDKVYPEAVTTNGDNGEVPLKDTSKIWQVDYGRVTPLIVKAVQELNLNTEAKLKAANDNIQTLSTEVEQLRQEVRQLKERR